MVPGFVQLLAHTTIAGSYMVGTEHGGSMVVYFLCKTAKALYELARMVLSGFLHTVFAVAVESVARTAIDVYVRADELNPDSSVLPHHNSKDLPRDQQQLFI